MFNFFANLALSLYYGQWVNMANQQIVYGFIQYMKVSPIFNMFNNSTSNFYDTNALGFVELEGVATAVPGLVVTIATILSIICCISFYFIIVKALKKLFTCFLGD